MLNVFSATVSPFQKLMDNFDGLIDFLQQVSSQSNTPLINMQPTHTTHKHPASVPPSSSPFKDSFAGKPGCRSQVSN